MLPIMLRFIWPSGFRGEDFFKSANPKQELPMAIVLFSSPCQRQGELLPSLGVCRPLSFHILIFSSETPQPNEVKLGRKHLWRVLSKESSFCHDPLTNKSSRCLWQGE
jgi:hypothetical protein